MASCVFNLDTNREAQVTRWDWEHRYAYAFTCIFIGVSLGVGALLNQNGTKFRGNRHN